MNTIAQGIHSYPVRFDSWQMILGITKNESYWACVHVTKRPNHHMWRRHATVVCGKIKQHVPWAQLNRTDMRTEYFVATSLKTGKFHWRTWTIKHHYKSQQSSSLLYCPPQNRGNRDTTNRKWRTWWHCLDSGSSGPGLNCGQALLCGMGKTTFLS